MNVREIDIVRMERVFDLIEDERWRQASKWDDGANSTAAWHYKLTEEVGEVATAILDLREANINGSVNQRQAARDHLKEEIVQVVALGVAWLEDLSE